MSGHIQNQGEPKHYSNLLKYTASLLMQILPTTYAPYAKENNASVNTAGVYSTTSRHDSKRKVHNVFCASTVVMTVNIHKVQVTLFQTFRLIFNCGL